MRFQTLFRIFVCFAVLSVTADFIITIVGFGKYIVFWEINPHIMVLMRYMSPRAAASVVFVFTLTLVLGSYRLVRDYFKEPPYDGGLRKVWRHLWNTASVKKKDLVIFALIALFVYFAYIHLTGVETWVEIFTRYP